MTPWTFFPSCAEQKLSLLNTHTPLPPSLSLSLHKDKNTGVHCCLVSGTDVTTKKKKKKKRSNNKKNRLDRNTGFFFNEENHSFVFT